MALTKQQRWIMEEEVADKMVDKIIDEVDPNEYRGYNPVMFRRTAIATLRGHISDNPKVAWWEEAYEDRAEAREALGFDPVTGEENE